MINTNLYILKDTHKLSSCRKPTHSVIENNMEEAIEVVYVILGTTKSAIQILFIFQGLIQSYLF